MNAPFFQSAVHFSGADAQTVGALVAAASDIALIVGGDGVIMDVAGAQEVLKQIGAAGWRGDRLDDVVAADSRPRVRDLIGTTPSGEGAVACDVEHATADGDSVLIRYSAVHAGKDGAVVLLGRNLNPLRALQDRLLTSQQAMERSFERQRQDEARYRMLFQIGSEAALIVDAANGQIREANPAAADLLATGAEAMAGRRLTHLFAKSDRAAIQTMLDHVAGAGAGEALTAHASADGRALSVKATLCRVGDGATFFVHLDRADTGGESAPADQNLARLIHVASEAVVLVDDGGEILWANEAFVALTQSGAMETLLSRSLGEFFDGAELDVGVTLATVRRHGRVKMLAARLRGATGETTDVELSLVSMPDGTPPGIGVVMRNVTLRVPASERRDPGPALAGAAIEDLIGKVPLKDLVREEMDVIEKNCIEAALKLTGNNRALTARVLGLSRQGLYSKLRRYGLVSDDD